MLYRRGDKKKLKKPPSSFPTFPKKRLERYSLVPRDETSYGALSCEKNKSTRPVLLPASNSRPTDGFASREISVDYRRIFVPYGFSRFVVTDYRRQKAARGGGAENRVFFSRHCSLSGARGSVNNAVTIKHRSYTVAFLNALFSLSSSLLFPVGKGKAAAAVETDHATRAARSVLDLTSTCRRRRHTRDTATLLPFTRTWNKVSEGLI